MSTEDSMVRDGVEPGPAYGWGWPFWKVGGVILVGVLAILVSAFVLNGQFRSPVGVEPIATALPTSNEAAGNAPTAGASATLEQQVMDAYLRYWDIRKAAYLALDTSHLAEVMADAELTREVTQIGDLERRSRAGKLDVEHHAVVVGATSDHATVYDEYVNHSVYLDVVTKQSLASDVPAEVEKVSYELRKFGDFWKVVDGSQHP